MSGGGGFDHCLKGSFTFSFVGREKSGHGHGGEGEGEGLLGWLGATGVALGWWEVAGKLFGVLCAWGESMMFMRLGWLGILLVTGCLARPLTESSPTTSNLFVDQIEQTAIDKIDLLFMVDN